MQKKIKKLFVAGCFVLMCAGLSACGKKAEKIPLKKAEQVDVPETAKPEADTSESSDRKEAPEKAKSADQEKEKSRKVSKKDDSEPVETKISVYVCGCVKNPGVYELKEGSRIKDAIEAAGGMTDAAHQTCLNQALKIADEDVIRVPTQESGEDILILEEGERDMCRAMAEAGLEPTGIDINSADKNTLMTLPGIGESKAEAIIAYRKKHNGFSAKEDLMEVSGIGPGVYEKLEERITVK